MASVVVTRAAVEDIDSLVLSHGLPADTRARLRRHLSILSRFPLAGQALSGRWDGARYLVGPWPWLIVLYEYDADDDRVSVLAIQDGRSSTAARP
ncbi:MAG: type II toxin-antitoxin system RelE/ParE family toxin [Solirubrobacteraceae bacterium]